MRVISPAQSLVIAAYFFGVCAIGLILSPPAWAGYQDANGNWSVPALSPSEKQGWSSGGTNASGYQSPTSNQQVMTSAHSTMSAMGVRVPADMTAQSPARGDLGNASSLHLTQTRHFTLKIVTTPAAGGSCSALNSCVFYSTTNKNVFDVGGASIWVTGMWPVTISMCDLSLEGGTCLTTGTQAEINARWTPQHAVTAAGTTVSGTPLLMSVTGDPNTVQPRDIWIIKGDCHQADGQCTLTLDQTYTQGGTPNMPTSPGNPNTLGMARLEASPMGQFMAGIRDGSASSADPSFSYSALRGTTGPNPHPGSLQAVGDCVQSREGQLEQSGMVALPVRCNPDQNDPFYGKSMAFDVTALSKPVVPPPASTNAQDDPSALSAVSAAANMTDQITKYGQANEDGTISVFKGKEASCKDPIGRFKSWYKVMEVTAPLLGGMADADKLGCCATDPRDVDVGANAGFCTQDEKDLAGARMAGRAYYIKGADTVSDKSICLGVGATSANLAGANLPLIGYDVAGYSATTGAATAMAGTLAWYYKHLDEPKVCGADGGSEINRAFLAVNMGLGTGNDHSAFAMGIWAAMAANQPVHVNDVKYYCSFPSLLAKIVQEQGRPQINTLAASTAAGAQVSQVTFPFYGKDRTVTRKGWTIPGDLKTHDNGSATEGGGTHTEPGDPVWVPPVTTVKDVTGNIVPSWQRCPLSPGGNWWSCRKGDAIVGGYHIWSYSSADDVDERLRACKAGPTCTESSATPAVWPSNCQAPYGNDTHQPGGWDNCLAFGQDYIYMTAHNYTWENRPVKVHLVTVTPGYYKEGPPITVTDPGVSTPNPPTVGADGTVTIPGGNFPVTAAAGWLPLWAVNGNTFTFWQWAGKCQLPGAQQGAYPTVATPDLDAAAKARAESASGANDCPGSNRTYMAVCQSAKCDALPATPMTPQAGQTPWVIFPLDTEDGTTLNAVTRFVVVQGSCDVSSHQCNYRVSGLPRGIGGQLHAQMPLEWSMHSMNAPGGGGWDKSTVMNHGQVWFEAKTWPKPDDGVTDPATPMLRYCLGTGAQCSPTDDSKWTVVGATKTWVPEVPAVPPVPATPDTYVPGAATVYNYTAHAGPDTSCGAYGIYCTTTESWTYGAVNVVLNSGSGIGWFQPYSLSINGGWATYPGGCNPVPTGSIACFLTTGGTTMYYVDASHKLHVVTVTIIPGTPATPGTPAIPGYWKTSGTPDLPNPLSVPGVQIIDTPKVILSGGGCDVTGCRYLADIYLHVEAMPWLFHGPSYPPYLRKQIQIRKELSVGGHTVVSEGYANMNWYYRSYPNCEGFTLDQFLSLDFSQIDLSDYVKTLTGKAKSKFLQGWPNQ